MNLLRRLKKNGTLAEFGNYRPVQPLNNRIVKSSFPVSEDHTSPSPSPCSVTKTVTVTVTETVTDNGTKEPTVAVDSGGASAVSMTVLLLLSTLSVALFLL